MQNYNTTHQYYTPSIFKEFQFSLCNNCNNTYVLDGKVYCNWDSINSKHQMIREMHVCQCEGYIPIYKEFF